WWFGGPLVVNTFAMTRPQLQGMKGVIPYHATGPAYQAFASAYQMATNMSAEDAPLAANDWDAAILIGLGLVAQAHRYPAEPFAGPHLRDAISLMGSTPPMGMLFSVDLGWRTAVAAINADMAIDYEGASGHCDFDAVHDVRGPVAVYRIDSGVWVVDKVY